MWPSTTDGRPALGTQAMGTRLAPERWRRASLISTGPVAQLRPTTSTCMASSTVSAAPISVPGSMRPVSSIVTWHCSGTLRSSATMARRAPVDGGLDREHVELRLDEQEVDAAFEQAERLLLVGVAELGVGDLPQRGELGARAHGAGHPARALGRRELVAHRAGQLGGPARQLAGAVGQPVLGEDDRRRAEGVGLDHVAADLVEGAVHLGHEVGARSRRGHSLQPSRSGPPKSSGPRPSSCRLVPMAPSKMTTRSRSACR